MLLFFEMCLESDLIAVSLKCMWKNTAATCLLAL